MSVIQYNTRIMLNRLRIPKIFSRFNWHDWIFTIGGIFLSVSLVPALWGAFTAPTWAATFAFLTLIGFTINYYSLKLYLSTFCCIVQIFLWGIILLNSLH